MNRFLVGSAVSATLALSGMAAHASCVDPRASSPQVAPFVNRHHPGAPFGGRNAAENIVGTWDVVYTTNPSSAPSGEAFIQWHSDGTEWENINYPVLGGNICMGSWKVVDGSHISRNHFGWLYNAGALAGWFNEVETDEVAWDGNSYTGTNTTTLNFYPMPPATTNTVVVLSGTSTATRIAP
jgi:hypothetical protein